MNKTIISFAKKYNMEYKEIQFMYGLTGYRFDFSLNDYNTMSWCKSMLFAHKNLIVESNIYTMCVTVYNRQEKEKACAFYELVKKLHDIFNLEYHETKDGSRAYDKVVDFVLLHPEYKKLLTAFIINFFTASRYPVRRYVHDVQAVFFALLCYICLLTAFNCFMVHFTGYGYKIISRKFYTIN